MQAAMTVLAESHALGGAAASTAVNRAHPALRRRRSSALAALTWLHSSKTFSDRGATAVSAERRDYLPTRSFV